MIRFNVIGTGFLDFKDGGSLAFKRANPHFRFAKVELGRSVEFTIPATDRNRSMLGFGEDPATYGTMLRKLHDCQMVYDGGAKTGALAVTAYQGGAFKCVFYLDAAEWVERLQGLKLSDVPTSFTKGVLWSTATSVVDADQADPTQVAQIVKYDNGQTSQTASWQLVPSLNVSAYLSDIFSNLGVPLSSRLSTDYWLVAGSMQGADADAVTFAQPSLTGGTVTQSQSYFAVVQRIMDWATARVFGQYIGGGTTTVSMFRVEQDVKATFGTVPQGVYLIRWGNTLRRCECIGGYDGNGNGTDISGTTVDMKRGDFYFFATFDGSLIDYDLILTSGYFGWQSGDYYIGSITATVARDGDLSLGEVWHLEYNRPDMTVFEFLKAVALATGLEIEIDPDNGVTLAEGGYGGTGDFVALEDVISIDSVERKVDCWGNTAKAVIAFDGDDYVTDTIESGYTIANANLTGEDEHTAGFSEGNVGDYGILVEDVKVDGSAYTFAAKKWTLAMVGTSSAYPDYLQRVDIPDPVGYDDIAANSTCLRVKVAAPEADFFALTPSTTFLWRGMAYLWTDADWADGILSLTLQRVSKQAVAEAD